MRSLLPRNHCVGPCIVGKLVVRAMFVERALPA